MGGCVGVVVHIMQVRVGGCVGVVVHIMQVRVSLPFTLHCDTCTN